MNDNAAAEPLIKNDTSIKEVYLSLKNTTSYLKSKWKKILFFALLGCALGLTYALVSKPLYTAVTTFVLDDGSKSGALSQYSGLASLAGVNLDNAGGGIFQSDNIMDLYTSRLMIEKTLLTKQQFDNKNELLIDRYIEFNELRDTWKKKAKLANINFNGNSNNFGRDQDSIITDITEKINKKNLTVSKPDKKTSIINVEFKAKDELFAKFFTEALVENVNSFYVQTKTKKAADNLRLLKAQADSVRAILNSSISGVAESIDAAPNANPYLSSLKVPSQRKQVDVQANAAIYAEVVKNIEIARMSFMEDKPLIQVIDQPVLPLDKTKTGKIAGTLVGGLIAIFFTVAVLLISRFLKSALS